MPKIRDKDIDGGGKKKKEAPVLTKEEIAKRRKRRAKGILIITIIMFVLIVAGAVALYFLGFLDPLLPLVGMTPRAEIVTFEKRQEQLIALEKALDLREQAVAEREEKVERKAQKLSELEDELEERENAPIDFNDKISQTDEARLDNLKKVSKICSTMEAEAAAKVLIELGSVDEMALVIYFMSEDAAADIMAALPEMTAARIMSLIMD